MKRLVDCVSHTFDATQLSQVVSLLLLVDIMSTASPLHSSLEAVLRENEEVAKLNQEYATNAPYSHIVLEPLCKPSFMADVHRELTENIKADFKETDLFKVFQTPELGSLEENELQTNMPSLLQLRHMLYSDRFRAMIERITGCQTLTDRVDCSANAYANSCHLLCHDDVIGTRCVSYIIYLSDPDDPWQAHEGGALELYPLLEEHAAQGQGEPQAIPSKTILPVFNSMLIFTVQPGRSYHSVQEVFCKHRPRLSISGWYHAATAPTGAQHASLQQILGNIPTPLGSTNEANQAFLPLIEHVFPPAASDIESSKKSSKTQPKGIKTKEIFGLTPSDIAQLKHYISPSYLKKESIVDIRQRFIDDSSVQLQDFLQSRWLTSLIPLLIRADESDKLGKSRASLDYSVGLTEHWGIVGPPHKQRYCRFAASSATDAIAQTHQDKAGEELMIIGTFLKSTLFGKYITALTTLEAQGQRQEIRRFRPGLDYTVAHIVQLNKERHLDATLCFVNDNRELEEQILASTAAEYDPQDNNHDSNKKRKASTSQTTTGKKAKKQAADEEAEDNDEEDELEGYAQHWADGDVGGFECFIAAEEDAEHAEAAEVYRGDLEQEESTLLSVSAGNNALSLVLRDRGIMKFVKYVSANAPGSRWDITTEYELPPDEDDSDDEDEENDVEEQD